MTQLSEFDVRAVAQEVVRVVPPCLRAMVAAPPVVVGCGPIATEVVAMSAQGWGAPEAALEVHCIGTQPDWAQAALARVGSRGTLTWSELPLVPAAVVRRVAELREYWTPPPEGRGEPTGPTVSVVLEDDIQTVSIAEAVAKSMPDARVAAVVSRALRQPANVTLIEADAIVPRARAAESNNPLAEVLLEDAQWSSAEASPATAPPVSLFEPDAAKTAAALTRGITSILAAGHVTTERIYTLDDGLIYLTPGELAAMARKILALLGMPESGGALLTAVELAYRLPQLVGRAGLDARRPVGYTQLLAPSVVEALAPLVHLTYLGAAVTTDNATGSPYATAMWSELSEFEKQSNRAAVTGSAVAFAIVGLDWVHDEDARPWEPTDAAQLEWLAELEHRRWAHHQRAYGRGRHKWVKLWADLGAAQEYDRRIVPAVARFLSFAQISIVPQRSPED